jgi:hypothetical protein
MALNLSFPPQLCSESTSWTSDTEKLFIVGAPRSGTTWLQAFLGSHSRVATGQETHFFKDFAPVEAAYCEQLPRAVGLQEYLPNGEFYSLCAELFHLITSRIPRPDGTVRYFLEKTPEHVFQAQFILKCFPDAKFIHMVRDPRHMVGSLIRTERAFGHGRDYMNATIAAEVWRKSVSAAARIPDLMRRSDQFTEIRYRDLRADPHHELGRLFDFLGLEATSQEIGEIVAANSLERVSKQASFAAIQSPSTKIAGEPRGFFGDGAIDENSFRLSYFERLQVERVTGELLEKYGYVDSAPSIPWWFLVVSSWRLRSFLRLPQV